MVLPSRGYHVIVEIDQAGMSELNFIRRLKQKREGGRGGGRGGGDVNVVWLKGCFL